MQLVENVELISINGTLIFQLISFLIFLFIIKRIMLRPLNQQVGERKSHLDAVAQEIATAQKTCDELSRQIRTQENEVRQEAMSMRDELEADGKKAADSIIAKTQEEIMAVRSKAHKENEAAVAAARRRLDVEAAGIADQMMASILGRRIES